MENLWKFLTAGYLGHLRPCPPAGHLDTANNLFLLYIRFTMKVWLVEGIQSIHNSLWTWHDKCNICCRDCIYHVKFNICLVTKPLGVFSSETKWLNTSNLFLGMNSRDELCEKCTIKQLLNSVFAWYHELSKPRVCVICLRLSASASADNTDLGFDNSWYHAQLHPVIV